MRDINVESMDAFHIASALETECRIFVTSDLKLGREIDNIEGLEWYKPEDLLKKLEEERL